MLWIGKLPPTVRRKSNVSRQHGRFVWVLVANEYEFEVMDDEIMNENNKTFIDNLHNKTCACGVVSFKLDFYTKIATLIYKGICVILLIIYGQNE